MNHDIDLQSLILGLSSAALGYLGFVTAEGHSDGNVNLALARQNIELIALLQVKTKGNTTVEEDELMREVLTDLRLKFVDVSRKQHS